MQKVEFELDEQELNNWLENQYIDSKRSKNSILGDLLKARDIIKKQQEDLQKTNKDLLALTVELEKELEKRKSTEKKLFAHNERLELLVDKRTASLKQLNSALLRQIEDKREIEKDLIENERKFRTLYDNSPDMYVSVSPDDASIKLCNKTLLKYTGYEAKELIGESVFFMYHESCLDDAKEAFNEFITTGKVRDKELKLKRKDGSIIDVSLNVDSVKDENGKILYSMSSWRDITERLKSEKIIRDNEKIFKAIFKNSPLGMAILDTSGKLLFVNPALVNFTGYSDEELKSMIFTEFTHPEDINKDLDKYLELVQGKIKSYKMEKRYINKNGEIVWGNLNVTGIRDDNDDLEFVLGMAEDITEVKELEESRESLLHDLRERNKELNCLYQLSRLTSDSKLGIIEVLKKTTEIIPPAWKYPEITEVKITFEDVEYKTPGFRESKWKLDKSFAVGSENEINIKVVYLKEMPAMYYGPFLKEEQELILALARNLSHYIERKKYEDKVLRQKEILEDLVAKRTSELIRANKDLEEFSYSVSHDLRAPLRHLSAFSQMLVEKISGIADKKALHYLDIINKSATKMDSLITAILNFSRTGRVTINKSRIDMNSLINEIIRDFQLDLTERKVNWIIGELPEINGDTLLIKQAFVNVISNAIKYTSLEEVAEITIIGNSNGDKATISIIDNGVGFASENADNIFGVFQRLHAEEEFNGIGIGLANVKKIITRHGGDITGKGSPGEGAEFTITLPNGEA